MTAYVPSNFLQLVQEFLGVPLSCLTKEEIAEAVQNLKNDADFKHYVNMMNLKEVVDKEL